MGSHIKKKHFVEIVTTLVTVLVKKTLCLCIYFSFAKKLLILSLFKIDTLSLTMYVFTIFTCLLKIYVIRLHNLISMNIFFTIKYHSFFITVKRKSKTNKTLLKTQTFLKSSFNEDFL